MPAVWGQEMVRQAGDNIVIPSTGGGGLNVCLALSYRCIVQADNRDDHLTKGGGGQSVVMRATP